MKRKLPALIALLLLLAMALCACSGGSGKTEQIDIVQPSANLYVTDNADILSADTERYIVDRLQRLKAACGGERVDVRSLADYIENRGEYDYAARQQRKGRVNYV